jgi:hypothetical protein
LRRSASQNRFCQKGVTLFHFVVVSRVRVGAERAKPQTAASYFLDSRQRKPGDIDQMSWTYDVFLY